jgi:3-phenylpropionate/cinnamic acid dioxygenase small subunit
MDDSRQIENLIYYYAERIDSGDLEGVAELFRNAEIVSTAHNVRRTGFDEVLQMYRLSCRLYDSTGTPLTKHLTTNVIVELDENGEEASARSYYTVIQATDALPLQPIISGRYTDRFRKTGTRWHFLSREMIVDLIGDCSAHLLYDSSGLL